MPTFKDLHQFVLKNKKDKTFKGYSFGQIGYMLQEGIKNNLLYYATDSSGNISGMILAKQEDDKTLWIEENLAMTLNNLKAFALKAQEQFPNYSFEGFKCRKSRKYNKLFNKLTT